ncbi:MAG: hypothetical protein NVS4B11_28350 [Ktedonobacteraceae bacterium]
MIRCNYCGTINPDDVTNCQNCMALLSAPVARGESEVSPRANTQDQPELPAWLESLRAGDRPAAPPKNFSSEDMSEEGKVPSWMQANRADNERNSNLYPTMRSAASPAPNTDEGYAQERNISANSLIDANALPSWMQPDGPQAPQQNIAASSLVQPEFMPDWMKSMQPSTQGQPSTPIPQPKPPTSPAVPTQGFSAQQLIDSQALPNWMQQADGQSFTPPQSVQPPHNEQMGNDPTGQAGFMASSLLDENSLPSWMREAERGAQEQRATMPQPQQATWQAPQQPAMPQRGYEQPWQASQQQASSPPWQMPQQQQPAYPPAPGGNASTQGPAGTLSMGSLIDMNALPEWLRSAAEAQQGQTGQPGNQQRSIGPNTMNSYGPPSRIENMRVPSRPRGEVGSNEGNEVAANVFASMLGVASNAPQYPAQPQQGYPTYPNGQPMENTMPPDQAQGMPNAQGYASGQLGPQNYGQMGYPNGMQPGQGTYPGAGPMMQQQNQNMPQMPQQGGNEKPAKKGGLFEAIRNFFFRQ